MRCRKLCLRLLHLHRIPKKSAVNEPEQEGLEILKGRKLSISRNDVWSEFLGICKHRFMQMKRWLESYFMNIYSRFIISTHAISYSEPA